MGYLISIISGVSYDKKDVCKSGIRILRGGNINNLQVLTFEDDVFLPKTYEDGDKQVRLNDILIVASTGSKTVIGKAGYINKELRDTQIGAFLRIVRPLFDELVDYIKLVFATDYYREHIRTQAQGTNINNVKAEYITRLLVPIPPINEQAHIVAEIEKYEPLIEEYDKLEQAKFKLDGEIYDKLKKSILQYAIQGKLVSQDENDEPASELLKRIRAEKKVQLGKKYVDSYIYKGDDNCYYEHIDEKVKDKAVEVPFDIPENWTWSRIETIFDLQAGKFISAEKISPIKDDSRPFPCYGGNGLRGYVDCYNHEGAYPLIGRQGALCGNINTVDGKFYATEHAVAVTYHCEMVIGVISAFLQAMNLNQYSTATAQPGLAVSKINKLLFPLPPLAEQERIVDKINEIFAKL